MPTLPQAAENVWLVTVLRCRLTVLGTRETICHAGTARLPRRHGTSAAPAWHVCRAGVANIQMLYTNIQKALCDGKMLCQNGCIALSTNKIAHSRKKVPILSIIFTSKNENASFFAASTVFLNLVCSIFTLLSTSQQPHTRSMALWASSPVCVEIGSCCWPGMHGWRSGIERGRGSCDESSRLVHSGAKGSGLA